MSEHVVYGLHAVSALLKSPFRNTQKVCISEARCDEPVRVLETQAKVKGIMIEKLSAKTMQIRFGTLNHQGIVAYALPLPEFAEQDLPGLLTKSKQPALILMLDGVTDPHNLGACLRSADAAGVDFVVIPKDKNASITPIVSKVACGAVETVPVVRVTNLVRSMECLKQEGVWIYGAAGEASSSLYTMDCRRSMAIVMGSEGEGLRRLTREHCDGLFALPMAGGVESLNVSVATGITLYEVVRQRLYAA